MVFAPQTTSPQGNARGAHGARWNKDVIDIDFAWVGFVSFGDIDFMSDVFTHELVETITDPGLNSSFPSTRSGMTMNRTIGGGTEIGDACNNTVDRLTGGLLVQAYWSNADKACIIPLGTFVGNGPSGAQAVASRIPTHLDVFWVAQDGSVMRNFFDVN